MLRKIYLELVEIRKTLQAIHSDLELSKVDIDVVSHQIQEHLIRQIEECADSVSVKC